VTAGAGWINPDPRPVRRRHSASSRSSIGVALVVNRVLLEGDAADVVEAFRMPADDAGENQNPRYRSARERPGICMSSDARHRGRGLGFGCRDERPATWCCQSIYTPRDFMPIKNYPGRLATIQRPREQHPATLEPQ
jgi:hypothetical protein